MRWSPAAPRPAGCPHRRLRRLLARELPAGVLLDASTLRPWASANFVGARHAFPCGGALASPARLQSHLAAIEWRLPGHIVADVVVEAAPGGADGFTIEVLTVED